MQQGGASPEVIVKTLISNFEIFFVHNPQADALNRTAWGKYELELPESILAPLVEACIPSGYKTLAQEKLR